MDLGLIDDLQHKMVSLLIDFRIMAEQLAETRKLCEEVLKQAEKELDDAKSNSGS